LLEQKINQVKHSLVSLRTLSNSFTNGDHGGINYTEHGIRYLRGQSITEEGLDLTDELYISVEDHTRMIRSEVISGDVLLTIAGSTGNCCVVRGVERANINQAIVKIRPLLHIDPDYLSIFLNSKYGRFQTNRLANGAVQLNVNFSEVGDIKVAIPSLETQRSLVAEIEAARQTRKQKLAQADELLSSLNVHLLDQLGLSAPIEKDQQIFAIQVGQIKSRLDSYSNQPRFRKLIQTLQSHQFPCSQLSAVATDIFSGVTPKSGGDAYTDKLKGIPFIRSGEITKDGSVVEDNTLFIKSEIHEKLMRHSQLQQDDLLIAIVGATIGSVGVYGRSTPANINQAIAAVRLDHSQVLPHFARWFLSSPVGQAILDYLKRPVARANINLEEIGEIFILIPPLEIQHSVIKQVDQARIEVRKLRQEAETEWEAAKTRFEQKLLGEEA
jgi:type I restriction enzyme, S subunit